MARLAAIAKSRMEVVSKTADAVARREPTPTSLPTAAEPVRKRTRRIDKCTSAAMGATNAAAPSSAGYASGSVLLEVRLA